MHPFATDSPERKNIVLYLALLSMPGAWILNTLLQIIIDPIPWWIEVPSVFGVYFIIYKVFNEHIWKWSCLRKFGLIKVPNVSGNWDGTLFTSYDDHKTEYRVYVTIEQNWTEMSMILKTDQSESHTRSASILVMQSEVPIFSYIYFSEPKSNATRTMHSHLGTGVLRIANNELEGQYYTGRDRSTFGSIRLWK